MRIYLICICILTFSSLSAQKYFRTFQLSDTTRYSERSGYGYDFLPTPGNSSKKPFYFSIQLPDGNYRITVKLGSKKHAGVTTVRVESRRLYVNQQKTAKGQFVETSFIVNKRTPLISGTESVKIKNREMGSLTWDNKLTLEFNGEAPVCESIKIDSVSNEVPTVFLCGNSTVVDQSREPWASWGQMIPYFFNSKICFANYAESGESANTFIGAGRLKKILTQIKKGDYLFVEFGHNDQKQKGPGKGAYYSFMYYLKMFVDEVREKGATPVLITPTQRRRFDESGHVVNSHGEYPDAIRWMAAKENVALIDLNEITKTLLESMGDSPSVKAYVHYPAGTFPGQNEALADNTHFSTYGAFEVAKCVITGIEKNVPGVAGYLKPGFVFNPKNPDDFNAFKWDLSPFFEQEKPDGN